MHQGVRVRAFRNYFVGAYIPPGIMMDYDMCMTCKKKEPVGQELNFFPEQRNTVMVCYAPTYLLVRSTLLKNGAAMPLKNTRCRAWFDQL